MSLQTASTKMGGCSHHLALAALLLFAVAATASPAKKPPMVQLDQSDIDVLNLALNLEYLEVCDWHKRWVLPSRVDDVAVSCD